MDQLKAKDTPASSTIDSEIGQPIAHDDTSRYRQIVGSIMYLMTQTRPDLAFAAGRIARGMANPTTKDMEAAERLMGHIWRTRTEGITYRKQHPTSSSGIKLNAFVDAEFAGDHLDRRSTTGSCHRLDTCAIFAWRSGKQKLTSRSSTESELIALASETDDTVVFRTLLGELNLLAQIPVPVHMGEPGDTEKDTAYVHEDNSSAVIIVRDRLYGARTKFLDVRLRALRERERDRILAFTLVNTKDQLADAFTKQLPKLEHIRSKQIMMNGNVAVSLGHGDKGE